MTKEEFVSDLREVFLGHAFQTSRKYENELLTRRERLSDIEFMALLNDERAKILADTDLIIHDLVIKEVDQNLEKDIGQDLEKVAIIIADKEAQNVKNGDWADAYFSLFENDHFVVHFIYGIIKDAQLRVIDGVKRWGFKKTTAGKKKITQAQIALFYRTMLVLGAYPEFTENGRTMEDNYKEIGARHGFSPGNFKNKFLSKDARPFKTMGDLVNALTFEVVESLVQTLPEKEKALDLLKIEKAKG